MKKDKKQKSTLLKDAGIEFKEHIVNEKQLVVVYFDFQYPMTAEDIKQVTTNNNVFLGSTTDLQRLLQDEKDIVNVTPK